ncbi:sensor histidine kinase [Lacrimispora brassicae]
MKRLRKTSFFQKILGTSILIVIIPMVVFQIYSTKTMERMVVERVMTETGDSVYLAASNIENLLSKIVSVQLFLYEDKELKEIAQETLELPLEYIDSDISKILNIRFADRVEEILKGLLFNTVVMRSNVTLVTSNGMILTNYNYDSRMREYILSEYMIGAKTGLKTIDWVGISENVDNSIYNQDAFMITLLKSMDISEKNERRANLLVSIMEKPLSELLAGKELKNRRFLVDQNGEIISSNDKAVLNTELVSILEDLPMGKDYGSQVFNSEKQGEVLVTYRKLKISPWIVIDVKPYEQIAADIRGNNEQLLLVNLTFIGIFLLIAGIIAGNISRPLRRLAETMAHTELEKPADELKNSELGGKEISQIYQCYEIMRVQILNLIKQNQEIEERKRETELTALQAQIKPHFLFNTLMSIRCAIQNGHSDKAVEMTQALSSFMRMSIVKIDEVIPLSQEIENLQNYVYIQNMRSSQTYELITNIEPDLNEYPVPKLIFQPLIENSIVHGFASKESGVIVFDAVKEDGKVKITITDNGCGFVINPLELKGDKDSGFGVSNVAQRIQLYYGSKYSLQYFSNKGTQVIIYLPDGWGDEYHV